MRARPLAGVVVVDLTMFVAGPFATMILADLGAEVIKIEPPQGDATRSNRIGPQIGGENAQFHSYNRNKKSVLINLKTPEGRAVLLDLVRHADALVENFRPGVMQRLGLDIATLHQANPRLVVVSISAFGQDGPWAQRPGYDLLVQALSGSMSLNGHAETGPAHIPFHIGDTGGGLYGAIAALAGIVEARRSGRGRHLDVAMLDAQLALLGDEVTNYRASGDVPRPHGGGHPMLAPYQAFATADRPIAVAAVGVEKFWHQLCEALGLPALRGDPRFVDNGARATNRAALEPILAASFRTRCRDEWLEILARSDVPAAPILDIGEALESEHVRHRGVEACVTTASGDEAAVARSAIKTVSESDPLIASAPALGADTHAVLTTRLGYDAPRLEALRRAGAIA
jgi:crotonobetainyl-CoA:carnitine CoA-transferase CaiB-like acyl-CoA transferase